MKSSHNDICCLDCSDTHCATMNCIDRFCPSCCINVCGESAHAAECEVAHGEPQVIWGNANFRVIELKDPREPEVIRIEEMVEGHWQFWDEMKEIPALQLANEILAAVTRKIGG